MDESSGLMYEREVSINFNDADDIARVYVASPAWMRKFDRLCAEHPENFKMTEISRENGRIVGKFYENAQRNGNNPVKQKRGRAPRSRKREWR